MCAPTDAVSVRNPCFKAVKYPSNDNTMVRVAGIETELDPVRHSRATLSWPKLIFTFETDLIVHFQVDNLIAHFQNSGVHP
jgi:hypothetical protein